MNNFYFNPSGSATLTAVAAVVLLLSLWIGPAASRLSGRRRAVLVGLRCLVVLLLIVAMLRPTWVRSDVKKQSATIAILCDRSRSMQVSDTLGGKSRSQQLYALLDESLPDLQKLADDFEIQIYQFDQDVRPLDFPAGLAELKTSPEGQETAIGAALEDVLQRNAGKRLAAIFILSDGAQRALSPRDTSPLSVAQRALDLDAPLYTFVFGEARGRNQARDVAITDLVATETVFVKNSLAATGSLRVAGYANQPIRVQLLFETSPGEMQVVQTVVHVAKQPDEIIPIRLNYVPAVPGEYKLTVRAENQDGELVTTNNELSTFVTVLGGGLDVLYLEGALRPEQHFIRAAIDASPDIKLDFHWISPRDRTAWPVDLADQFMLDRYDVYMIGDLDSAALSRDEWDLFARRVEQGAGLVMIGGLHSFGPGGYRDTALANVLPIEMGRFERQSFDQPIRDDLQLPGPLHMRPTDPLGLTHPLMNLGGELGALDAWSKLPALDGANLFRSNSLKPNAIVLAESAEPPQAPLLVAGGWGDGRVLAMAGDSTWHWQLEGYEREFRRFWRQVVLWLAKRDETSDRSVWIKLQRRRYEPDSRVEFTVGARTPQGEPIDDAAFQAEIVFPDGQRRPARLARDGSRVVGSLVETQASGDYRIAVTASQRGTSIGRAESRFLVDKQDLELDNATADPGLLANMAEATRSIGGRSLAPEELPELVQQLSQKPPKYEIEIREKHNYWDTWPYFLLFVALISAEWYFRKRWRLV